MIVTGANGFLGSYVVAALLKKGHSVTGLKRASASVTWFDRILKIELGDAYTSLINHFTWQEADVLDIIALDEIIKEGDTVFHCAAMVAFNSKTADEMMSVNIQGTTNVVNACITAKVKKLIHVSSTAALGRSGKNTPISEQTEWKDSDHNTRYAISKHLSELEVWRGIEEGLNAAIVNPAIILGFGNPEQGSCRLFKNIAEGIRFYTNGVNGFVGVKDVAAVMIQLGENNITAERFLLVSENKSYCEIFMGMAKSLGVKAPSIELKKSYRWLLVQAARVVQFFNHRSSITPETIRTSLAENHYENNKARTVLNYTFQPIDVVISESALHYKALL